VVEILLDVSLDLLASLGGSDRYQRVAASVRRVVPAEAVLLLRVDGEALQVLACDGLPERLRNHRFSVAEQPWLAAIMTADQPQRFGPGDPGPHPLVGLGGAAAEMPACLGSVLSLDGELLGALLLLSGSADAFSAYEEIALRAYAALAAAVLRSGAFFEALQAGLQEKGHEEIVDQDWQMYGQSAALKRLQADIDRVAVSDLTVLILGECGLEKEHVARQLHERSHRAQQSFVCIECAKMDEHVSPDELFSGQGETWRGTLFLEEVGALALPAQTSLLDALRAQDTRLRVLASSSQDLAGMVRAGRFLPDLYHRLGVFPLHVPPLREREDDLQYLAERYLERARSRLGCGPISLHASAEGALCAWSWPGNLRELERALLHGAVRASQLRPEEPVMVESSHLDMELRKEESREEDLPAHGLGVSAAANHAPGNGQHVDLREAVDEYQRHLILQTVGACEGNWAKAARRLGTDRSNLYRIGKRLGLK